MSTEAHELEEPRTNVDYFRKLHQQLVQKDNIIKLLQMQVKNLEEAGADPEAMARLSDALAESEARLAEVEAGRAEEATARRKLLEAEGELDRLRSVEKDRDRLSAALTLKSEELERHRDLLREVEGADRELRSARADAEARADELTRLQAEVGRLREEAARRDRGGPPEVRALRQRIEDLEAALLVAREAVTSMQTSGGALFVDGEGGAEGVPFAVIQQVIEGLQVLQDHDAEVYSDVEALESLGAILGDLRAALGLERIPTVGASFDPNLHVKGQVRWLEDAEHEAIVDEEVTGWRRGETVVKLAQVTVARNPNRCERCATLGVNGATFCHGCGARIPRAERGVSGEAKKGANPRETTRHLVDAARSHAARGDLDAARTTLEEALAAVPGDPRALIELALVDELAGDFEAACGRLAQLPEVVPGVKDLARHRARVADKAEILARLTRVR